MSYFSDPDGGYLRIENLVATNSQITTLSPQEWTITPDQKDFTGDIDISFTVADEYGGTVIGETTVTFKAPSYITLESHGNISLLKDEANYAFAQDDNGNTKAITYYGDHLSLETWEGWTFLAAENIEGINSVIWKYSEPGNDIYWLSHHDENWEFTHTNAIK